MNPAEFLKQQVGVFEDFSPERLHLTPEHVEVLFGPGHQLTRRADLSQPGQSACEETLAMVGPKGSVERMCVLGPARIYTQVEIAMTEQFKNLRWVGADGSELRARHAH